MPPHVQYIGLVYSKLNAVGFGMLLQTSSWAATQQAADSGVAAEGEGAAGEAGEVGAETVAVAAAGVVEADEGEEGGGAEGVVGAVAGVGAETRWLRLVRAGGLV